MRPFWFSDSFALFVVLTFDFFARREEFVEEKSPGADAPRLASTVVVVYFVYFVVQFLVVIGLRATPALGPSWWNKPMTCDRDDRIVYSTWARIHFMSTFQTLRKYFYVSIDVLQINL